MAENNYTIDLDVNVIYPPKIDVKIKRMSDTAILPTYGSEKAACMDLYADNDMSEEREKYKEWGSTTFLPDTTVKIGTGFAFQPPKGYCGLIFARSGLATKQGLRPANCVGVCDEDYTGEYIVPLYNDSGERQNIRHGDRIAQLMFVPYSQANLIEVEELDTTERAENGFGSTGV